jgi:hypothetical protein
MEKSIPVTMSFIPYGITTLQECSFTNSMLLALIEDS